AEPARVHGMIGVALELDDAALAVPGEDAAAGGALAAHRREVRGDTGDEVLGRRNEGIQLFRRRSTSRGGGRRAGCRHDSEEGSPINPAHRALPLSTLTNSSRREAPAS